MDWILEDNMVDGLFFCATLTGENVNPYHIYAFGFHHAPSARLMSPLIVTHTEQLNPTTFTVKVNQHKQGACN